MKRRSRHNIPVLLAYAGVLMLLIGGLSYAAFQAYGKPTADAYGCFDAAPQPHTFTVFDANEPRFNEEQARSLRTYFDQVYETLDFNERLSFVTSEADQVASVTAPRFHVCGQATAPAQLEAIGAAGAQAGYLKKQEERLYEKLVAPELTALLSLDPREKRRQLYQSPIIEMIGDISPMPELKPGSRIILVSDLVQNSDSAQFCRTQNDMPRFSVFKQRPVYARLKPKSLEGIEIEVLMIQRLGYGRTGLEYCSSEDELIAFWRDFFDDNGAAARFIRIRHGHVEG